MARRWNRVQTSFRAGQLSPASQEDVSSEEWEMGLARLENYQVERDGGLRPRPRFQRHAELAVPVPAWGQLAPRQSSWQVQAGEGTDVNGDAIGPAAHAFQDGLYAEGADGIGEINATIAVPANSTTRFGLRITLPSCRARALTFHDVRIVSGTWFGTDAGRRRLNFRARVRRAGRTVDVTPAPGATEDEDPHAWGMMVPGATLRDVVLPLQGGAEPELVDRVELYCPRAGNGTFTYFVGGVSCFADAQDGAGVYLPRGLLDAPCRVIPWPQRGLPFALVLGMEFIGWVNLAQPDAWRSQTRQRTFTARQLRELTWLHYGSELLLCHRDFTRPLRVRLEPTATVGDALRVEPLALENVPIMPAFVEIPPQVGATGSVVALGGGGVGGVPVSPTQLTATALVRSVVVKWPDADADTYTLFYAPRAQDEASPPVRQSVSGLTALTHTLTGLTPGTEYAFRVRSVKGDSTSELSPAVHATPTHPQLMAPRLTATASSTLHQTITLGWSNPPAAGLLRTELQWRRVGSTAWNAQASTSFVGTAGQSYEFRARFLGQPAYPDSEWSAVVRATAPNLLPAAPSNLRITRLSTSSISIGWTAGARATSYVVEYRQGFGSWRTTSRTGTGATISGLSSGSTYSFRVKSRRSGQPDSAYSNIVTGTTRRAPSAPSSINTSGVGVSTTNIYTAQWTGSVSWSAVSGATSYEYAVRPGRDNRWTDFIGNPQQRTIWSGWGSPRTGGPTVSVGQMGLPAVDLGSSRSGLLYGIFRVRARAVTRYTNPDGSSTTLRSGWRESGVVSSRDLIRAR